MRISPFSAYVGGQWRRPYDAIANDRITAAQGLIPRWTTEDEVNLARRVRQRATVREAAA